MTEFNDKTASSCATLKLCLNKHRDQQLFSKYPQINIQYSTIIKENENRETYGKMCLNYAEFLNFSAYDFAPVE